MATGGEVRGHRTGKGLVVRGRKTRKNDRKIVQKEKMMASSKYGRRAERWNEGRRIKVERT